MKIAFPVNEDNGLDSMINDHFGVAKTFLIVDMETKEYELIDNKKVSDGASSCKTGIFSKKEHVNAVVTKCMGDGSQRNLSKLNIKVFQAVKDTVSENIELIEKDELKLFHIFDFCQTKKNKKEGGCGHH
jgi:predicted Fe-Mo cluster-binding NifX family protein